MTLPPYLWEIKEEIEGYARDFGLDFYETIFEILTYDQMNMVAARGGFPVRYPHWRFGMEYERLSKSYTYGLSKIYEMVINNNPAYAYLLEGNNIVDQKTVIAHVYAHVDFFKNNYYFQHTNRKMIDEMANHATRIRKYIERYGLDVVEDFIDRCLSIDNLIDYYSPYIVRRAPPKEEEDIGPVSVSKIPTKDYLDSFVNPQEFLDAQRKKLEAEREKKKRFPEEPERDVMLFLLEHAPLEKWQRDVLSIMREEAYYFAPQGMTKIMNEGWACIAGDELVFTERGLIPMADLVGGAARFVSDGESTRRVYDQHIIRDHETIEVRTKRGLRLKGSNNHRVLLADGTTWRRLDELKTGDKIAVSGGAGLWPAEQVSLSWPPQTRVILGDVAEQAGVSIYTVLRHRAGRNIRNATAVAAALATYEEEENQALSTNVSRRSQVRIPKQVDAALGAFLGYLLGDGYISRAKRHLGLTSGDEDQAVAFLTLAQELFGVMPVLKKDGNRWQVLIHSETVSDFLIEGLGLTSGPSAHEKQIPPAILRSPEPVVRAFLRAYFDCDGYAGKQGVILSTSSDALAEQVQLLLLNYGILSQKRKQKDGCWHVHASGASAARFAEKIGFGLTRKQEALKRYVESHRWNKEERWEDEVVSLEPGRADVYDISVEETHRYAAAGLINHNSYWHSMIMTQKACNDAEIIDYADQNSAVMAVSPGRINPYKLGVELLRFIEDRWNKGQFGREWEECQDLEARRSWNKNLGLGRQKIFEVRKFYNDVTFIDEFFTEDFVREQGFYVFGYNRRQNRFEITSKDFKEIKKKLLDSLTNFGQPFISVVDGNFENRGELLLKHRHEGVDLKLDYARDTLTNLHALWKRPVHLLTRVEGSGRLLSFNGREHMEKGVAYV